MKIDLTAADIQKIAGNSLTKKPNAEKFLKKHKAKLVAAMIEAANEIMEDWVFDHEITESPVEAADDDWEDD